MLINDLHEQEDQVTMNDTPGTEVLPSTTDKPLQSSFPPCYPSSW